MGSSAKQIFGALALLAATAATTPSACATEAVAYQGNIAHSGDVNLKSFSLPLKRVWRRFLGGTVSYPLIANGMVFITVGIPSTNVSKLMALSLDSGKTLWKKGVTDGFWNHVDAAYDDGKLFVLGKSGLLAAVTADATGKVLWAEQLPGQTVFSGPPTAYKGRIYLAGSGWGGTFYSIDENTGAVMWTQPVENGDGGAPAVGAAGVYATYPSQYYKFSFSGVPLWHVEDGCEGGGGRTPVYHAKRLYVRDIPCTTGTGNPVLDANTGNTLTILHASLTSPAVFTGETGQPMMVQLDPFHTLRCVNTETGRLKWTFKKHYLLTSAPLVVNQMAIEGSYSGHLYALDRHTGVVLWSDNVGSRIQQPDEQNENGPIPGFAAAEGTLLVPASNSLVAYRPATAVNASLSDSRT